MTKTADKPPKANPNSVLVTFSPITMLRLETLAEDGYFGGTPPLVARRFVEDRLRDMLRDGWLKEVRLPPAASTPSADGSPDD